MWNWYRDDHLDLYAITATGAVAWIFVTPPLSMLSGATTPLEAIPNWLQPITLLNPVRRFATLARGLMLKDVGDRGGLSDLSTLAGIHYHFDGPEHVVLS